MAIHSPKREGPYHNNVLFQVSLISILISIIINPSHQAEYYPSNSTLPPLNPRLSKAYIALQAWKHSITSDPKNFTLNWCGPHVCNYTGIYCAPAPDDPHIYTVAGVDLNHATISGSLPEELGLLTDLSLFHINSNRFCGSIPNSFDQLHLLHELDISNNKFSGPFPEILLCIPSLKYLDIRFNNFHGNVPSRLFDLKLDALFINNNNFQFSLPENFGNSPASVVVFANNNLKGCLPSSLVKMKSTLNEIIVMNSGLTGCLPQEIGELHKVTVFDVSFNKLVGELPESLGRMKKLEQLNVAHNMLSGTVPESVCLLPRLQNFTYSYNYFCEESPVCLKLKHKNKGFIDDKLRHGLKAQPVAVKLLDLDGSQGHKEWLTEVVFLGQLRHPHLVKLIGYCCEEEHRLLVYEYLPRGSLENQLFRRFSASLPWSTRMKIAVGAAKGLAFLHEAEKPVIYRDFKASNILLDSDYNAKLSDFGLAKDGPEGDDTHVSTRVMGTHGYAAPEYVMTGHLTAMSDVYSFGVVLLELLTGRRSVDKNRPPREQNLVEWARPMLNDSRKLKRIMDPRLEGQYSEMGTRKAAALAYQCLSHRPRSRPSMTTVVKTLEPLQDFDDIPIGTFVYTAPPDTTNNNNEVHKDGREYDAPKRRENNHNGHHRNHHRHHPLKSPKSSPKPQSQSQNRSLNNDHKHRNGRGSGSNSPLSNVKRPYVERTHI